MKQSGIVVNVVSVEPIAFAASAVENDVAKTVGERDVPVAIFVGSRGYGEFAAAIIACVAYGAALCIACESYATMQGAAISSYFALLGVVGKFFARGLLGGSIAERCAVIAVGSFYGIVAIICLCGLDYLADALR